MDLNSAQCLLSRLCSAGLLYNPCNTHSFVITHIHSHGSALPCTLKCVYTHVLNVVYTRYSLSLSV